MFKFIFNCLQNLPSRQDSSLENISKQLQLINENLAALIKVMESQSFLNSQLFAAIIGASAAILVLIMKEIWDWRRKRSERLKKTYSWITQNHVWINPRSLFEKASSTGYGYTKTDSVTGETTQIKDKPLGEKMSIELRRMVKYRDFNSILLRRLFAKYNRSLLTFNGYDGKTEDQRNNFLNNSERIFEKIKRRAFRRIGEDEFTLR
jgi:hypothetical protein